MEDTGHVVGMGLPDRYSDAAAVVWVVDHSREDSPASAAGPDIGPFGGETTEMPFLDLE